MKKEVAEKWIADLRANPDLQGKGYLEHNDKYCCLGRLCVVLDMPLPDDKLVLSDHEVIAAGMYSKVGRLPHRFPSKNYENDNQEFGWLSELNDNGYSFAEIADIIEKYWEAI